MLGPDGFRHALSNVIVNGPIPELTDINIGSRVSLDGLGWKGPQPGDTAWDAVVNTATSNIVGASLAKNIVGGYEDIAKGDVSRGIEQLLPAGFKGAMTAIRFHEKGARTSKDDEVLKPEDFTWQNIATTVAGLQPTKLATAQKRRMNAMGVDKEVEASKTSALDAVEKWRRNRDDPALRDRAQEAIWKHNDKYPAAAWRITPKIVRQSEKSHKAAHKATVSGTRMTKKDRGLYMGSIGAGLPAYGSSRDYPDEDDGSED
jgi:hypothetical protein